MIQVEKATFKPDDGRVTVGIKFEGVISSELLTLSSAAAILSISRIRIVEEIRPFSSRDGMARLSNVKLVQSSLTYTAFNSARVSCVQRLAAAGIRGSADCFEDINFDLTAMSSGKRAERANAEKG